MTRRFLGAYPEYDLKYFDAFHDCPAEVLNGLEQIGEMDCERTRALAPHAHRGIEICYVASGSLWRAVAGRRYRVGAGRFFVGAPGEVHAGGADPADPCRYFAIAFELETIAGTGQPGDVRASLAEAIRVGTTRRVLPGTRAAERVLRHILDELARLERGDGDRVLTLAMVHALLLEFAILLARCANAPDDEVVGDPQGRAPGAFAELLRWMPTRLASPPSLAEMAERAGLSRSHFCAAFRRAVGISPAAYVLRARLEAAARRLASCDAPISEVAGAVGFASAQRFATAFRQAKGCSPRRWRERHR